MRIRVKMTRAGNIARHGEGIAELDLEEYLCGVVPAEIGEGSHGDALRAQAVAARTFAVRRVLSGVVVDDTARFQAYRATAIILPLMGALRQGAGRFGAGIIPTI